MRLIKTASVIREGSRSIKIASFDLFSTLEKASARAKKIRVAPPLEDVVPLFSPREKGSHAKVKKTRKERPLSLSSSKGKAKIETFPANSSFFFPFLRQKRLNCHFSPFSGALLGHRRRGGHLRALLLLQRHHRLQSGRYGGHG